MSLDEQKRLLIVESDISALRGEQMRLLERVSLLELTSRMYEDQFDRH